ncbi:hypothetical protein BD410DRAFT_902853 [Rickenella mellea]|uniref:Protein kinase domain-containing protein n=1 Tax=Rickenella mellea TaxID=50990 RepID=A0A4Y7PK53_9AGAM|nr:hypothetical protein BD410DRAFT_902853 [Rickenella mellea]
MAQLPDTTHPIMCGNSGHERSTWKQDIDEFLRSTTEVDAEKCIEAARGMKIYKRVLAFVYIQIQTCHSNSASARSERFFKELKRWSSWDAIQSLCKHDVIRTTLWEFVQRCYEPNQIKPVAGGHSLKQMLYRDESDVRFQVEEIVKDQSQRRRLTELCLENPAPLLNLLQMLLDLDTRSNGSSRLLVQTIARLAKKSGTYPDSLSLTHVKPSGSHPVMGGGFADIWRGAYMDHPVALKALRVFFNDSSTKKEMVFQDFAHEAVVWRQLRHRNILPFYGIFKGNHTFDRLCLVSPWMDAGNIINFLKHSPDSDRISLLGDIVDGLRYLHEFDPTVVHGDLKGSNIFVTSSRIACLADFGLTRFRDPQHSTWESTTGSSRGTIRWQARELLVPGDDGKTARPSRESDIYSFGCVCLEVITGNVPFSELTEAAVTVAIVQNKTPQRPDRDFVEYGVDDSLWKIIESCLDTEASQRPSVVQLSQCFDRRARITAKGSNDHGHFPPITRATLEMYGFPKNYLTQIAQLKGTPADPTTITPRDSPINEMANVGQHKQEPQPRNTSATTIGSGPPRVFERQNSNNYRTTEHQRTEPPIVQTVFIYNQSNSSAQPNSETRTERQPQPTTESYAKVGQNLIDRFVTPLRGYFSPSSAQPQNENRRDGRSPVQNPTVQQPNSTVSDSASAPSPVNRSTISQSLRPPTPIDGTKVMVPTPIPQMTNPTVKESLTAAILASQRATAPSPQPQTGISKNPYPMLLRSPTQSSTNSVLSWTSQDPRQSLLFSSQGLIYRFETNISPNTMAVTTVWRSTRANKQDRVALLEWARNGDLGRVRMGKMSVAMIDLAKPDVIDKNTKTFIGPDGYRYQWIRNWMDEGKGSVYSNGIYLCHPDNSVMAWIYYIQPTRYPYGDVYVELHFLSPSIISSPPLMDVITISAMLYRFCDLRDSQSLGNM